MHHTEWLLYDSKTSKLDLATASSWEKAVRIALSRGIVPRKPDDVRPRKVGRGENRVGTERELAEILDEL